MDISLAQQVKVRVEWITHHEWDPELRPQISAQPVNKLWITSRGSNLVTVDDCEWKVGAGTVFLTSSSHKRTLVITPEECELWSVAFHVTLFGQYNLLQSLSEPVLWTPAEAEYSRLLTWVRQMTELASIEGNVEESDVADSTAGSKQIVSNGLGEAIFGVCWKHLETERKISLPAPKVVEHLAVAFAVMRRMPSISIAEWARAVGFSPAQFRRLFHERLGMSPQECLTRHRVEEAQRLLQTTDLPVVAIAERLGFDSISHFSRLFRRACGESPGKYRRKKIDEYPDRF